MKRIYHISDLREKKYKIKFPVGEVIYNDLFRQAVIDNDLENFFKIQLDQDWSFMTMEEAMKSRVEQILITWISNTDNNKIITIHMGLKREKITYDDDYNENIAYSVYYQVVNTKLENISEKLKTFDEAFSIFKKKINELITFNI